MIFLIGEIQLWKLSVEEIYKKKPAKGVHSKDIVLP
jgi:hypothetical protein